MLSEENIGLFSWIKDIAIPLLSFAAAYLGAKRALASSHRDSLYWKQLDAAAEIMPLIYETDKAESTEEIRAHFRKLELLEKKWSVYLPESVIRQFTKVKSATIWRLQLSAGDPANSFYPPSRQETSYAFFEAQIGMAVALRQMIGVEPLTEEMRKIFHELESKQDKSGVR